MAENHKRTVKYVVAEPRWKWFNPPFWWCFRWAFKVHDVKTLDGVYPSGATIRQSQKGGRGANQVQIGIVNNYQKEEDTTTITFPCKLKYLIDVVFSHNELVMIWYEDPTDPHYSKLWFKGHAHELPTEILESKFIKIKGILQEKITDSDYISIEVRRKG